MKFTPTAKFTAICDGASKVIVRKVYVRKVTDLTLTLASNDTPWIDVTDRVLAYPEFESSVELDIAIPTTQGCEFEFFGIAWWKANIFNATSTEFIEIKVEEQIGLSNSDLATDINYAFSGCLDKKYTPNNNTDSLTVQARSLDDLLSSIIGETFTRQVLDANGYLTLQSIPGVAVSNANVSGYVLKEGVHTIAYDYSDEAHHAKLDDGDYVELADGTVTLSNSIKDPISESNYVDQKVEIQVDTSLLAYASATCDIIVTAAGTTIPKTWYNRISIYRLFKEIYKQVGLTSYSFDDFKLATYDGRRVPTFWDIPPGDSFYKKPTAVCYDATNNRVYIACTDRIYYRNLTTNEYTNCGTITAGYEIVRLWGQDAASGYIWGVARNSSGAHKIVKVTIATPAVADYTITRTLTTVGAEQNFALDLNIRGIYYSYYPAGKVNIFFLDSLTESQFTYSGLLWEYPAYADGSGNYYVYKLFGPSDYELVKITYSGGGITGAVQSGIFLHPFVNAAYNAGLGLWIGSTDQNKVYKWSPSIGSPVEIDAVDSEMHNFVTDEVHDYVYYMAIDATTDGLILKRANNSTVETLDEALNWVFMSALLGVGFYLADHLCYDSTLDRFIGLNYYGMLYEYHTDASMYIQTEFDLEGSNLREGLNELLLSYLLVNIISTAKKVIVMRRLDDAGALVNSGNSITLDNSNIEDADEECLYSSAVGWLSVNNGEVSHSYDGTTWDNKYYGTGKTMELTAKYIPDNLIEDVVYYLYNFFKNDHALYSILLSNILPLQIECLDGALLSINSKVVKSGTGTIYSVHEAEDGQITLKVLT